MVFDAQDIRLKESVPVLTWAMFCLQNSMTRRESTYLAKEKTYRDKKKQDKNINSVKQTGRYTGLVRLRPTKVLRHT